MRIGALIPIRLASERLPGKALLPIVGRPVVAHLLDRVFASRHIAPERVVVCTTREASDDALLPVVEAAGARVYRGSTDDLIDRFRGAARELALDAFLQVDGDDPCADPGYMDRCMDRLLEDPSLGVVLAEGLPLGLASKAVRTEALETVWRHRVGERNDTGFAYYFTKTPLCRKGVVEPVSDAHRHAEARLTLDYPEDLEFFRRLFEALWSPGRVFEVAEIVELLRRRPDLVAVNAHRTQEFWQRTRERAHLEYELDGRVHRVEI